MSEQVSGHLTWNANYVLLVLGAGAYFLFNFVWFSFPALLAVVIVDIDLSHTQAGILNGTISFVYIFLSLVAGVIIDRFGPKLAITFGLFVFGSAQFVRGFAVDFPTLLAATVLMGIGGTGVSFGLPKLVAHFFAPERSGTMSSGYLVGAHFGATSAFFLLRPFVEPLLGGWRPVFVWSGAFTIGYGILWLLISPRLGRAHTTSSTYETADGGTKRSSNTHITFHSLIADVSTVVTHRDIKLLTVIGTMQLAILHGLRGWLSVILESTGISAGIAATTVSILIVAQIVGTVTLPPLSDRLDRRRGVIIGCGGLTAIGMGGLLLLGNASALRAILLVGAIGVGLGGVSPLLRALPIELEEVGPRLTATSVGIIFSVGQVGGFLGPFLIGMFRDVSGSFAGGLLMLVVASATIVIAGWLMEEPDTGN